MSDAMSFFHRKKITHRDIKPENIIYSHDDNTFVIVDFGFAKYHKRRPSRSYQEIIVRKRYIDLDSENKGIVDHVSDQYMFAKMLLEILELFKTLYLDYNYSGIRASRCGELTEEDVLERRKAIQSKIANAMSEMEDLATQLETDPNHEVAWQRADGKWFHS